MPKYILRHGCDNPTSEAFICPSCRTRTNKYNLAEKVFRNPYRAELRCASTGMPIAPSLVPTFECLKCGCIWQWESDPSRHEKDEKTKNKG